MRRFEHTAYTTCRFFSVQDFDRRALLFDIGGLLRKSNSLRLCTARWAVVMW